MVNAAAPTSSRTTNTPEPSQAARSRRESMPPKCSTNGTQRADRPKSAVVESNDDATRPDAVRSGFSPLRVMNEY